MQGKRERHCPILLKVLQVEEGTGRWAQILGTVLWILA